MKHKKSQLIMVWLLPLIVIGGLFVPVLGYLVVAMMAFLLVLSIFKGRYWCWHLCPRGAFLDLGMSKFSPNRPMPRLFTRQAFRWLVVAGFMAFLAYRIIQSGGTFIAIGSVFVGMCILTTVIAMILAVILRHRTWCAICPMGTLQETIYNTRNPKSS